MTCDFTNSVLFYLLSVLFVFTFVFFFFIVTKMRNRAMKLTPPKIHMFNTAPLVSEIVLHVS